MNKTIEKILLLFLVIQPFLDVIAITNYNILNISIRSLFLVFIVIYLLYNKKNLKLLILILLIALIILGINIYLNRNIIDSISSIMKLYYLPLIIIFFISIKNSFDNKMILYTLFIYLIIFIASYIFGFGYDNYDPLVKKTGFRGVFNSINEISAIIIGLLPISLNYLKERKKYIVSIILILFTLLVALLTGTKVLMIGLFIIIIFIYIKDAFDIFKKMTRIKKIITIICLLLSLLLAVYLLTYTRFYKNMIVQQEFFKSYNILSINFINKVIFNNRLTFLKDNFMLYKSQNIINIIFGIGYNNDIIKLVEIDIFDILFRFGIIGLTSFIIPILFIIKKINLNKVALFSIILLILISLTSGHVLLNPNVSIYFGYIILINNKKKESSKYKSS